MAFELDRELLDRALNNDASALNTLVGQLRPHVERQLLRYPVADEDRRDLLQTTLMQVVRRLGSFRGDSSFSTWLFRVTANEALMMMRSQRRHRSRLVEGLDLEDLAALPSMRDAEAEKRGESMAVDSERNALLEQAIAELPADYRDVVLAHYQMDLGLHEIARRYELSESAVRSRLHRARSRLRSMLERSPFREESMDMRLPEIRSEVRLNTQPLAQRAQAIAEAASQSEARPTVSRDLQVAA